MILLPSAMATNLQYLAVTAFHCYSVSDPASYEHDDTYNLPIETDTNATENSVYFLEIHIYHKLRSGYVDGSFVQIPEKLTKHKINTVRWIWFDV